MVVHSKRIKEECDIDEWKLFDTSKLKKEFADIWIISKGRIDYVW